VKKSADQSITSNVTLASDSALAFSMAANTAYTVRLVVFFDTGATEDFQFAISGPTSPTYVRIRRRYFPPGSTSATNAMDTAATPATSITGAGTTGGYIEADVIWQNGANAGTFAFEWAQNTSGATATIVRAGSFMEYMTSP
jgi:hypothetical protein